MLTSKRRSRLGVEKSSQGPSVWKMSAPSGISIGRGPRSRMNASPVSTLTTRRKTDSSSASTRLCCTTRGSSGRGLMSPSIVS